MPKPELHAAQASLKTGDYENWFVHCAYRSHSEVWKFLMVEGAFSENLKQWYEVHGFQDRDGQWWLMFHDFFNTAKQAEANFRDDLFDAPYRDHWYLEL